MTESENGAQKKCPNCGMTLARFRRSGLFGCAECYHIFREEAERTVLKVQGKLRHVQKTVSPEEVKRSLDLQKKVLQDRYRQALNEEKESEAIEIESEIEKLDLIEKNDFKEASAEREAETRTKFSVREDPA